MAVRSTALWAGSLSPSASVILKELRRELEHVSRDHRVPKCAHQILEKSQIVPRQQHGGDNLATFDDVVQIGAGIAPTTLARTIRIERRRIIGVARIAQVERSGPGKRLPIAARTG